MLQKVADTVRVLSAEAVEKAGSGHPGMPLGCAEIGAVLFGEVMNYHPQEPGWFNRDRLILSAGHGSIWLYTLLHLAGYDLSLEDLKEYRKFGSVTPGHPELGVTLGVEMSTGPLGQGLAHAVGIALGERILAGRFNQDGFRVVDHFTYVLASDGDMMEGVSYEACSFAGSLGLHKLIVIYDDNGISIDGKTEITFCDDMEQRFQAMNWEVIGNVDAHDIDSLSKALARAKENQDKPSLIIASSIIGKGAPGLEGESRAHGAPLGEEVIAGMKKELSFPEESFYIPPEVKGFFEKRKRDSGAKYREWDEGFSRWKEAYPRLYDKWLESHDYSVTVDPDGIKPDYSSGKSTRDYGGEIYRVLLDELEYLLGGSADLSDSTKICTNKHTPISRGNYAGRHVHFGVREHAMAAVAGGLALGGGVRPVISTYLTFSDYMKPSLRLAGMMGLPVIYVFTHDSLYVGEDGPTHQPIEQLEALRQIPGFRVIRPADGRETLLAWHEALMEKGKPVALILSRQGLPYLDVPVDSNTFGHGAYIVKECFGEKCVAIVASGSEVSLALRVASKLQKQGTESRVISVPERVKLEGNKDYVRSLTGDDCELIVAIEAGVPCGWYRLVGSDGLVFGLEDYGLSGDGQKVAAFLGMDEDKIVEKIRERLATKG